MHYKNQYPFAIHVLQQSKKVIYTSGTKNPHKMPGESSQQQTMIQLVTEIMQNGECITKK